MNLRNRVIRLEQKRRPTPGDKRLCYLTIQVVPSRGENGELRGGTEERIVTIRLGEKVPAVTKGPSPDDDSPCGN